MFVRNSESQIITKKNYEMESKNHTLQQDTKCRDFRSKGLLERLGSIVDQDFPPLPLATQLSYDNVQQIANDFVTLSIAFPYIQAAAHWDLVSNSLEKGKPLPTDVQLTAVVGSFLTWDEFGGNSVLLRDGMRGLPKILDLRRFHSNILVRDLSGLLGDAIAPSNATHTRSYLSTLRSMLSSQRASIRVANMLSFEVFASRVILSLWDGLRRLYGRRAESLEYFVMHIGKDNPAERFHIETVARLIELTTTVDEEGSLIDCFRSGYLVHSQWVSNIVAVQR